MNEMYERTALLIGEAGVETLQNSFVALVGLGGVGGHCAEALARAGVGRLHIVDCDAVTVSNLNRQLVATRETIGERKTAAMTRRLLAVSACAVTSSDARIGAENVSAYIPGDADFIVDAVDSLSGKLALIGFGEQAGLPVVSCMGAGNRLDPTRFRVKDIFETEGDPLARNLRRALRRMGVSALPVVCSEEPPTVRPGQTVIGSFAPVTAAAGLCCAGYVLRRLLEKTRVSS